MMKLLGDINIETFLFSFSFPIGPRLNVSKVSGLVLSQGSRVDDQCLHNQYHDQ